MAKRSLDILVVTDLHYRMPDADDGGLKDRRGDLARILLRKTLWRLRHMGRWPELVILLGDLVNDGQTANRLLGDLATELDQERAFRVLAVPGNHDGDPAAVAAAFTCPPGLHEIGGYGFLVFHDPYAEGDHCQRTDADLELPGRIAAARPDLPLIALQHSPLHPEIDSPYPYLPDNAAAIRAGYEAAGVRLSLSGHYHPGQPRHEHQGVIYQTLPALCTAPFSFTLFHLEDETIQAEELHLALDVPGLSDCHCHTEYSYCGTDVNIATDLTLAAALGVGRQCLTEHAFQLYYPSAPSWSWRWQTDPDMVERAWRQERHRMDEFIAVARGLRAAGTAVGLELDLLTDGRLLLAPEDKTHFDYFIGAVHNIPEAGNGELTQARAESLFMRDVQRLLEHRVEILAHPFRFFRRGKLATPTHLFGDVADWLRASGTAAEINYHTNQPPAAFIEACLERGVRLATGTDSHDLAEVGELWPHLDLLRRVGVRAADLPGILWQPPRPGEPKPAAGV